MFHILMVSKQGEELKKLIGAPAYIECSAKTQQVLTWESISLSNLYLSKTANWICWWFLYLLSVQQNVKAVFDAAIKVVLQPPKNKKKKKRKSQKGCSILWFNKKKGINRRIRAISICFLLFHNLFTQGIKNLLFVVWKWQKLKN